MNIQSLAIELFKVFKGIANPNLCDIFPLRSINYNLRYQTGFSVNCMKTNHFGLDSLRYFASKVWNMVPPELKNLNEVKCVNLELENWNQRSANTNSVIYTKHRLY